jgi:predicted nucleotidyltransferase
MSSVAPSAVSRRLGVSSDALGEFCRRHAIARLAVFGSILREDDFSDESDVDVLVEFVPGRVPGLEFFGMQEELSGLFRRAVDLQTPNSLSRYFRDEVLSQAEDQYVAA